MLLNISFVETLVNRILFIYQIRAVKICSLILVYTFIACFSLWLAYQLRFDFFIDGRASDSEYRDRIPYVILWVALLKLITLFFIRQYSGLISYFGTPDIVRIAKALVVTSAIIGVIRIAIVNYYMPIQEPQVASYYVPSRGIILIDFLLFFLLLVGFRVLCRVIREISTRPHEEGNTRIKAYRILIIGAGDVGADLAKELLNKRGLGRNPVAFLDDNPEKKNVRIHNIPVIGGLNCLEEVKYKLQIEEVIIAMPKASAKRIGEIINALQEARLKFTTVPSLDQMATGKVKVSQLRPVEFQDLLGREPVKIEREDIREMVENRVVLVTGAGGSIGSELCRQLATFNPERLLMVEQCEYLLFEIEQQLIEKGFAGIVRPLVANILDDERMSEIFEIFTPQIVFHAAALKHVPMMESQPSEAIKVNSFGTCRLARLSQREKVSRFVMISTDKAINPTSVMGASKRLAEMYLQALDGEKSNPTSFMAVRFGNVLGSSGSVIPTFKRQIAAGGPVRVTHPDVSRYFMTISEAVGLVLQCGSQGCGGEIFVLDMGQPVKIADLARELIQLSGLRPDEDIEIEYIGLRSGEKLYEELQHGEENIKPTKHQKIKCLISTPYSFEEFESRMHRLKGLLHGESRYKIKQTLKSVVPDYSPFPE